MANDVFDIIGPDELIALDMLHDASQYIAAHFDVRMSRADAQANLEARAIIFNCCNKIFKEHGCGISREEIEGSKCGQCALFRASAGCLHDIVSGAEKHDPACAYWKPR